MARISPINILNLLLLLIQLIVLTNGVQFKQLFCEFENNSMCNWDPLKANYTQYKWQWVRAQTRTVNFTGALMGVYDSGYFLQLWTPNASYSSPTGALQSPILDQTVGTFCWSFYYYIHGVDANRIELQISNSSKQSLIWQRKFPAGDMWHKAMINIPPQPSNFTLRYMIYSGGGAVAFDQFNAMDGNCPVNEVCDFESGMCDWTPQPSSSSTYLLHRVQGMYAANTTEDHTTDTQYGYFLEANNGNPNDVTAITSSKYPANFGTICLMFWYWRRNTAHHQIDVFLGDDTTKDNILSITPNTIFPNSTWHRAMTTINFAKSQFIVIQATSLVSQSSQIDIDDISQKPGSCPPPINCDFNNDMCGFKRDMRPDNGFIVVWDHGFGRVEDGRAMKFVYPPRDRLSPMRGMFMYTDFSRMTLNGAYTMILNSEYVPLTAVSCLTFWYQVMTFDETKNSFTIRTEDNKGNLINVVWTYTSKEDPFSSQVTKNWVRRQVEIHSDVPFRLSFQVHSTNASTYLAMDDVVYTLGVCSPNTTAVTTTTTARPIQNLSCDFESANYCNWQNNVSYPWKLNYVNVALLAMMPNTDHTKQNAQGRYVYVYHDQTMAATNTTNKAIITIIDTPDSNYLGSICVSFWYYMRTNSFSHFNVTLTTPNVQNPIISSRFNDKGEKWNLYTLDVNMSSNGFTIGISAIVSYGIVAIDDIKITHQTCAQQQPNLFQCTFEDDGHVCGFTPLYSGTLAKWTYFVGNDTYFKIMDHTLKTRSGHVFALDYSTQAGTGSGTSSGVTYNYKIASQKFRQTTGSCVTFWYYMRGLSKNESLTFSIQKENLAYLTTLWTVTGEQGPFWYSHRATVNSTLSWQIIFGATAQQTKDGLIAIDDVSVEIDKPCPKQGVCDFENGDTCMWENILPTMSSITQQQKLRWSNIDIGQQALNNILLKTDFTWTVHTPQHGMLAAYPKVDHTLNSDKGFYLLMRNESPRKVGDRAVLMSDRFDVDPHNPSFCFKFYVWIKASSSGSNNANLEMFKSENYTLVTKLMDFSTPTYGIGTSWVAQSVTVTADTSNSTQMWFYIVGTAGDSGSFVAVDDISITAGDCVSPSMIFNCTDNESISLTKVCDFAKDCSNGKDELLCGSCDFVSITPFVQSYCGYQRSRVGNSNDSNAIQWRGGDLTTGPKIGADGSSGYLIARRTGATLNEPKGVADLRSPTLRSASASCYINFRYNLFGNITSANSGVVPITQLSVILVSESGSEQTHLWDSEALDNSIIPGQWMHANAYLTRITYNYYIIFRAIDVGSTTDSYVAVDDITFRDCSLPPKTVANHDYQFQCDNGAAVSLAYICDFADDCGDNSDEKNCDKQKQCDFENGFCDWGNEVKTGWIIFTGQENLVNAPTRDHTKGIKSGHFLYIWSAQQDSPSNAMIDGPSFQTGKECYMRFWMDMEGNATGIDGYITITAKYRNGTQVLIYDSQTYYFPMRTYYYAWRIIYFDLISEPFKLYLGGNLNGFSTTRVNNWIAIDDISFSDQCIKYNTGQSSTLTTSTPVVTTPSPCSNTQFRCKLSNPAKCIDRTQVCDFNKDCGGNDNSDEADCGSCGFNNNSMCGWSNIGEGKQQWTIQRASNFALNPTIPKVDGTGSATGSFLIIDTSQGGTFNLPAIISTPLLGATGPNCRMQFMFHQTYPNSEEDNVYFKVYLHRHSGVVVNKQIAYISGQSLNASFKPYTVMIGAITAGYQILIQAMSSATQTTLPFADLEIDEIQFQNCSILDNTTSSLNCSFETGNCGWYDLNLNTSNQLDWIRTKSQQISPGFDHTSQIRPTQKLYGYWIYTRRMPGMKGNNTATLMSQSAVQPTTVGAYKCLTFWYHMFGRDYANFSLIINQQKSINGGQVLWLKQLPQSNNWIKATVSFVSPTYPYYVMFRASLQANSQDTIGIDDITFTDGQCPPTQELCDFEANTCRWKSVTDNDWVRVTPSNDNTAVKLPKVDHTVGTAYGNYLKLGSPNHLSILATSVHNVVYINNTIPPNISQKKCIKFWYYFGGASDSSAILKISINTSTGKEGTYWTRSYDVISQSGGLAQWLYGRTNFPAANNDTIHISAQCSSNTNQLQTVIAIDDVVVQDDNCQPPGWCDFESDMCGWTNTPPQTNKKSVLWLRNSGDTEAQYSGPSEDHTTGTDQGWYAYVPLDSQLDGTAVMQSELLFEYSPTACLQFYYHMMSETAVLGPKLQVLWITSNNTNPKIIANITDQKYDRWIGFNITLNNMTDIYRIMFKTFMGNVSRCDVAIDDIAIYRGTCQTALMTTTTIAPQTTPLSVTEKQWDCDFEGQCVWSYDANWIKTWWQPNYSEFGPRVDHTFKNASGHYLLFKAQSNSTTVATITSTPLNTGSTVNSDHCLSFWYFIDTESQYNLNVMYINPVNNYQYTSYVLTQTIATNSWQILSAQLPKIVNLRVIIKLLRDSAKPFVGGIAIDDIKVTPGQCPTRSGSLCTFEYNFCNYELTRSNPGIGYLYSPLGGTGYPSSMPLPAVDHTTGVGSGRYFLFANQLSDASAGYKTEIVITNLTSTGARGSCLKFWYQIYSNYSVGFYVYSAAINSNSYGNTEWTAMYPYYRNWTLAQQTITVQFAHKIIFMFGKTKDLNSYIAVDDISLSDGACEPPVSCDFDTDSCSWRESNSSVISNWNWGRYTGPPTNSSWPGPPLDHTINRWGGSYLYSTAWRTNVTRDRTAVIESMPTYYAASHCFSYWTQIYGNDASIQVILLQYARNKTTNVPLYQTTSLSRVNGTIKPWTKINIDVKTELVYNYTEVAFKIIGRFSNPQSFIALDDIKLTDGQCVNSGTDVSFCTDGTQLTDDQICNFVVNCPRPPYDDEINCGVCDFEKDTCFWTNTLRTGQQWVRKSAQEFKTFPFGPSVDAKNNNTASYLIINPRTGDGSTDPAQLQSNTAKNKLKVAFQTCLMNFDYWMNVTTGTLRVRIKFGSSIDYVYRLSGSQGNKWNKAVVNIYEQRAPFVIEFVGSYSGQSDTIAIDDISYQNCGQPVITGQTCSSGQIQCQTNKRCIDANVLCDSMDDCGDAWDESSNNCKSNVSKCSFDSSFCDFTQESDSPNAKWIRVESVASNVNRDTGPVSDHTNRRVGSGSVVSVSGNANTFGKSVRLVSRMLKSVSGKSCALRFFYYMFGKSVGILNVNIRYVDRSTNTAFTKNGNVGQLWNRAIVVTSSNNTRSFQFIIEAKMTTNSTSADIAIDDVSYSDGCVVSNELPPTTTTTTTVRTTQRVTQTTQNTRTTSKTGTTKGIGNLNVGNTSPNPSGSNTGGIVAGVLVPVFVVFAIIGAYFYRRYRLQHMSEDRIAFTNPTYGIRNMAETSLDETDHNHENTPKDPQK